MHLPTYTHPHVHTRGAHAHTHLCTDENVRAQGATGLSWAASGKRERTSPGNARDPGLRELHSHCTDRLTVRRLSSGPISQTAAPWVERRSARAGTEGAPRTSPRRAALGTATPQTPSLPPHRRRAREAARDHRTRGEPPGAAWCPPAPGLSGAPSPGVTRGSGVSLTQPGPGRPLPRWLAACFPGARPTEKGSGGPAPRALPALLGGNENVSLSARGARSCLCTGSKPCASAASNASAGSGTPSPGSALLSC